MCRAHGLQARGRRRSQARGGRQRASRSIGTSRSSATAFAIFCRFPFAKPPGRWSRARSCNTAAANASMTVQHDVIEEISNASAPKFMPQTAVCPASSRAILNSANQVADLPAPLRPSNSVMLRAGTVGERLSRKRWSPGQAPVHGEQSAYRCYRAYTSIHN